jgi:hypothetical protein
MLVAVAATAALTLSAAGAHASPLAGTPEPSPSDDFYKPANTLVTGTASVLLTTAQCGGHTPPAGTVTCFSIPGTSPVITVFCSHSVAGGTTSAYDPASPGGPGDGDDAKAFHISPLPVFDDQPTHPYCTDSLGGHDTSVANETNGKWTIGLKDLTNDEAGPEPNADHLVVNVPKAGVIVTNTLGCTITVAPTAAFKVTGAYDDVNKFTVSITNLPIITSGGSCPLPASAVSTFNAIYTFSPGVSDGS